MKSFLSGLVVIAAFFGMQLLVQAILTEDSSQPQSTTTTTSGSSFRREAERTYMDACVDGVESNRTYCQCTFDYLEGSIGLEGLIEMGRQYEDTGKINDDGWDAVEACYEHLT